MKNTRKENRLTELNYLLNQKRKYAGNCRKYGLVDEYIAAMTDIDQLEITIEEMEEQ